MDNVLYMKQIVEKLISVNRKIHMLFIDLWKAYDNVPNLNLWQDVPETEINETIIKTVEELYKHWN